MTGMGLNENWGKRVVIICHSLVVFGRWKVTGMGLGMGMVVGMEVIVAQVPLERVSLFVSSMVTCIFYIKNLNLEKKTHACCPW